MISVRLASRRLMVALTAILALAGAGLSIATPAAASGTTYARYNTGYPNTWARIVWTEGSSIHTNGRKVFSIACGIGCDDGWGEMVMESGDIFQLYVTDGDEGPPKTFYSGVDRFRFCLRNVSCTAWKYN